MDAVIAERAIDEAIAKGSTPTFSFDFDQEADPIVRTRATLGAMAHQPEQGPGTYSPGPGIGIDTPPGIPDEFGFSTAADLVTAAASKLWDMVNSTNPTDKQKAIEAALQRRQELTTTGPTHERLRWNIWFSKMDRQRQWFPDA